MIVISLKAVSLTLLICLTGCQAYWYPSADFGSSVNGAIALQTVDPDAAKKAPTVVRGMDGPSAKASVESYQKTFTRITPSGSAAGASGSSQGSSASSPSSSGSNTASPR